MELPAFIAGIAGIFGASGQPPSVGAERFLSRPARESVPTVLPQPDGQELRESAVLAVVCGRSLDEAGLIIEERAHSMRSQPAQFALPGGRVDPEDASHVAAALREADEEIGLHPRTHPELAVLGAFAPIRMPVRPMAVTPVLAWHPAPPARLAETLKPSATEVERIIIPGLTGAGSLTDPSVMRRATAGGVRVGYAFDLPFDPASPDDDSFVWGFTAAVLCGLLGHLVPGFEPSDTAAEAQVPVTRLLGERKRR